MVWAAGHTLQNGKFTIQDVLGQGGFGITYKALHTRLNTFVVIKTPNEYLKHDPDYDTYVDRFIKEGQRLAQLSQDPHPHIVRVWDLFEEGEIPCMVMDFVPGENLFQLVRRRGALPETEIVPCIRQVGEALSAIHQAGLVHRDAHPGNIIVRPDTRAILIDFGIAKELTPSTQSSTGESGNKGFAPYEQISRGSREPTVDIYCLAATLYFAVTGERPVTSLDRSLYDVTLIAPKQHKPNLSEHLNQAILKGMTLEAKERPQTIQSWLDLLQEPIIQAQTPAREVAKIPAQRNRNHTSRRSSSLPLGNLAFVLVGHVTTGTLLSVSSAPSEAVVGAIAVTVAVAVAVAVAGIMPRNLSYIPTMYLVAMTAMGIWAIARAAVGAIVGVGAGTVAMAVAGDRLLESSNRSHTFLVLVGTSSVGLGLGWLIGTLLLSFRIVAI